MNGIPNLRKSLCTPRGVLKFIAIICVRTGIAPSVNEAEKAIARKKLENESLAMAFIRHLILSEQATTPSPSTQAAMGNIAGIVVNIGEELYRKPLKVAQAVTLIMTFLMKKAGYVRHSDSTTSPIGIFTEFVDANFYSQMMDYLAKNYGSTTEDRVVEFQKSRC